MKFLNLFSLFFLFLFLLACSKSTTDVNKNGYTISGTITNKFGPVENAKVSIDESLNWTEYTDQSGHFEIDGVEKGKHTLKIEKNNDEAFVEKVGTINVTQDQNITSLRLPLPVKLYQPTEITSSEILIKWNPTDAEDFREYKIFRSTSPGLDETTGKLIYVSTSKMDTTFKDTKLASGLTYYYRVYIMNDLGRIGGSNIVHVQTKICNLIPDGGFEIVGSIYENWQSAWGDKKTFEYDDSIFVSGNYSLHGINPQPDGQQYPTTTDMRMINPITLVPGLNYKISAWMKASGMAEGTFESVTIGLNTLNGGHGVAAIQIFDARATTEPVKIDWTYRSKIFSVETETKVIPYFYSGFNDFWIDDLKLIVVE